MGWAGRERRWKEWKMYSNTQHTLSVPHDINQKSLWETNIHKYPPLSLSITTARIKSDYFTYQTFLHILSVPVFIIKDHFSCQAEKRHENNFYWTFSESNNELGKYTLWCMKSAHISNPNIVTKWSLNLHWFRLLFWDKVPKVV